MLTPPVLRFSPLSRGRLLTTGIRQSDAWSGGIVIGDAHYDSSGMLNAEVRRLRADGSRDPDFGTDRTTSAVVDFGEGRQLTFTVSTQTVPYQRVNIFGTKARLEVEIPFNAPQGGAMKLYLDDGKKLGDASAKTIKIAKADQYQLEGEAFSRIVRGEEPLVYGVEDAILQAKVLDAIFRSEKSGRWEKP